ncbi:MAG: cell division protein ZapA [Limnochordaceae bacterium]|uniref:Cell division protein ZapA n=1 Tax=Carboxydichorda subterranea TaxID=3109565 RepID=A0ABZ1C1I9_9FIRM|nr:cell division protein ZapA [Limnochorda sp. L945t]MBE3597581.1 cell division protein ZapA [Limnochordaceae bacterium]WRP18705.1 cell division protein ZapA [Limnochorda sp. L945t]
MRVRIAGSTYALRGPASEEHLRALAGELDRRLQAVIRRNPRLALHQAAVLCALEILEELEEQRRKEHRPRRRTGRSTP